MKEVWKDVVGYEGRYVVSNMGNVREVGAATNLKQYGSGNGYLIVSLNDGSKRKNRLLHRVIATAFIANPDNKPQVNHINGIGVDNRLENLEWVTVSENQRHAVRTGLSKFTSVTGENAVHSKLKESDVLEIINLRLVEKLKYRVIGEKYGVSMAVIVEIFRGNNWKQITRNSELFNSRKLARYYSGKNIPQTTKEVKYA